MTDDTSPTSTAGESDRSLKTRALLAAQDVFWGERLNVNTLGDRAAPAVKAMLVAFAAVFVLSNPAAAQSYCDEGVGLLISNTQVMLWQLALGLLVIIAILGLLLRAFPVFTGATATGNLMIMGVIVGVIGFVFVLTFIDFAFGVVGGPGIGSGCSPFL